MRSLLVATDLSARSERALARAMALAGFHVPRPTREFCLSRTRISHTGLSPSPVRLSRRVPLSVPIDYAAPTTPPEGGLGSSPFARRY